ncbi:MAG: 5-bromo-4-chloroindolyl phosphate hydrolysis family protein, partial [Pseudomonadota bacterium]
TEGMNEYQTERVARAVDEAEAHLAAMRDAIRRAGVSKLDRRVDAFAETARGMFRVVEEDPRDLTAARKFLSVYLMGARDATVQFADLYARSKNEEARKDYETLLDDLESSFAQKTEKLLLDDKSMLDVEIEVLRDRLEREGVRSEV